jgi:DNA-binding response OmpR family regulator
MRVLVVEDFRPLRESIVQGLEEAGYAVDAASNGVDGFRIASIGGHDVIILDIMLPQLDGLTVLRRLRQAGAPAMVILLTAKDTTQDRVNGLDGGADDYLVKPFDFAELLARVRALIRRKYETRDAVVRIDDLEIDTTRRIVRRDGKTIDLSGREYALLEYLALNAERTVTRTDIWQHVYDFNASPESNVVDVFVGNLRRKIEKPGSRRLIHTRRGQGYRIGVENESP